MTENGGSTNGTDRFCWHVVPTDDESFLAYDSHLSWSEAVETLETANESLDKRFSLKGVPDCSVCAETNQ